MGEIIAYFYADKNVLLERDNWQQWISGRCLWASGKRWRLLKYSPGGYRQFIYSGRRESRERTDACGRELWWNRKHSSAKGEDGGDVACSRTGEGMLWLSREISYSCLISLRTQFNLILKFQVRLVSILVCFSSAMSTVWVGDCGVEIMYNQNWEFACIYCSTYSIYHLKKV